MPKFVYCSSCGAKLPVTRKALKRHQRIIDLVDQHECLEEMRGLDLDEIGEFTAEPVGDKKFVKKLNDLSPPPSIGAISTDNLSDRRIPEHIKQSAAPKGLIDQFDFLANSQPERESDEE